MHDIHKEEAQWGSGRILVSFRTQHLFTQVRNGFIFRFVSRFSIPDINAKAVPLARREEQRLSVFENRVLKRIFGTEMEKVIGGWK
jgi:hypothetical protein